MNNEKKLYYSEELIRSIEILGGVLSEASDERLYNEKIRYYADYKPHLSRLNTIVPFIPNKAKTILEIGSGIGTNCLLMKAITEATIIGIEPAPDSYAPLLNCIRDFKEANRHLPYLNLNCGGESINYESESCDFIYSFEVLEHVQNPKQVLKEIYRLLKPGAKAYISTCNYDSFYEGHYKHFWNPFCSPEENGKRFEKKGMSSTFLNELNFITKKDIKRYAEEIGFSKIEFNPYVEGKEEYNVKGIYPMSFQLPKGYHVEPTWLHKMLEKPHVAGFLGKFDREYKIYMLLSK